MNNDLLELRARITEADNEIIEALELRMKLTEEIAEYKKEKNLPIEDKKREKEIISDRKLQTALSQQFIEDLFQLIFKESKKIQNDN